MPYFSEKETGPRPRTEEIINPAVWGGIVAHIQKLVATGAFGKEYPLQCPDGRGTIGTDENLFSLALQAQMYGLQWPLQTKRTDAEAFSSNEPFAPETLLILDLVQFCFNKVAKPLPYSYHQFLGHDHLNFDVEAGRQEFRKEINGLFARNGVAYELDSGGAIVRLGPPILREAVSDFIFCTGDTTLDQMLEEARRKFINPNTSIRREAVERLWDAWERIKSLEEPEDKKISINLLLTKAASDPDILKMFDDEGRELTRIGNKFHIRHTEMDQILITDSDHLDYLFHRLFAMIQLLLRKR
jgi:hypothetical protein